MVTRAVTTPAYSLLQIVPMALRCERCSGLTWEAYCVTSEEDGAVMLKMFVCHACYLEAKRIGLRARQIANPNLIEIQTLQ
jgi:hypothetical protein